MVGRFLSWSRAMEAALYGPAGFYRTQGGPAAHFRTSVHASPLFATAIVRLLREVDEALGHPREITLVDVGAGRGELLESVRTLLADDPQANEPPANEPLLKRLRLIAVEVAARPDNMTKDIEWRSELPERGSVTGLLIANEWLDNVPCDVVQATADGWRAVEVATDGTERLGAAPAPDQQAWLDAWWPVEESSIGSTPANPSDADTTAGSRNARTAASSTEAGTVVGSPDAGAVATRAEIGLTRDAAWQQAVATLAHGVAVAIDYAHTRASRPPFGTLTGYAHGRQTAPVPDGSCDITAHVALDACAAAAASCAEWTVHSDQRTVLHSLGITGARPGLALASSDPRGYLRALSQASAAAELTDVHGLGGFGWLIQGVSAPVPPSLAGLDSPPGPVVHVP